MARCTIDQKKNRWLIAPDDIGERSALLKLPARKWMNMQGLFVVPATPANARAILEQYNAHQLEIDADLWEACTEKTQPARTDRQWPTWYKFNTSVYQPMAHQVEALQRLYPVNEAAALMEMGCFSGDTEYLSPGGWRRLDSYDGGLVGQYVPGDTPESGFVKFVQPTEYINKSCVDWYHVSHDRGLDLMVDGNHRLAYWDQGLKEIKPPAMMAKGTSSVQVPCLFRHDDRGLSRPYTESEIRLQVAVLADGHFPRMAPYTTRVRVSVKKSRKKDRIRDLLTACGLDWHEYDDDKGFTSFHFNAPARAKSFEEWGAWGLSREQMTVVLDEVFHWDGHDYGTGRKAYYSNNRSDVDFIQYLAHTNGLRAQVCENRGNWHCEIRKTQGPLNMRGVNIRKVDYAGNKYSFSVPSTWLVVRRGGNIVVSGNTAKTRVAIDLMSAHFYERRIMFAIVICPLTVKMGTWIDELERFSPCPYNFIDVDSNYNAASFRPMQDRMQWLVVGVESLSQGRTFENLLPVTRLGLPYAVVVDESTRIANHKAICTQAAFELRRLCMGQREHGETKGVRMIMTGFEIKKNMEDLYAQFEFLNPDIIGCGDFLAFRNRYCMMGGFKNKEIVGYNNVEELMGLIAPHVYQCDKSRLALPPKMYEKRPVRLSPEQVAAYRKVKAGAIERVSIANSLTKTLRLQQVAAGYYNTDKWELDPRTGERVEVESECVEVVPPAKNPKLQEILKVAKEISHPMIVWANSRYEIKILTDALGRLGPYCCLTGDTPKDERRALITDFQKGNTPFFIGMQSAGGIGITLTAARTVIYFSNDHRLEMRVQSEDRAHRTGQTGSVTIIDLPAIGTVDVSILANHREKIDTATYVKRLLRERLASEAMEAFYNGEVDQSIVRELAQDIPLLAPV